MGIVHDAAAYLPDLLNHMADNYPSLTVKNGVLGRNSDIETTTMAQYRDQVYDLEPIHREFSISIFQSFLRKWENDNS